MRRSPFFMAGGKTQPHEGSFHPNNTGLTARLTARRYRAQTPNLEFGMMRFVLDLVRILSELRTTLTNKVLSAVFYLLPF